MYLLWEIFYFVLVIISVTKFFKLGKKWKFYIYSAVAVLSAAALHILIYLFYIFPSGQASYGTAYASVFYLGLLILYYIISSVTFAFKNPPAAPINYGRYLVIVKAYAVISFIAILSFILALLENFKETFLVILLTLVAAAALGRLFYYLSQKRTNFYNAFVWLSLLMLVVIWIGGLALELLF
jgi:hypothetical protein